MTVKLTDEQLAQRIDQVVPETLQDLIHLVSIPSISAQPQHDADVNRCAEEIVGYLKLLNIDDVTIVEEGGKPAIIGHFKVDESLPTICLYSHYDVQPTGDLEAWTSDPFTATTRHGRLYGRGPADDKGGIAAHLAALRAFDGKLPVNVTVLFEGEEEMGSPTLAKILKAHQEELEADAYLINDCGNWAVGQPSFTTSLRGVCDAIVEVRTLNYGLHSGEYGGALPDAVTVLCRLIASLHDAEGNVAVKGLVSEDSAVVEYSEERLREEANVPQNTQVIGSGSIGSRLWRKPAIDVIGFDTTSIADSANLLIPAAKARISMRIAPGDNRENAFNCLKKHLEENIEWAAELHVTNNEAANPSELPTQGAFFELAKKAWTKAFKTEPSLIGAGGSIGMIADFMAAYPDSFILGCGVADPSSRMHGIDESLDLADWTKTSLAIATLLNDATNLER